MIPGESCCRDTALRLWGVALGTKLGIQQHSIPPHACLSLVHGKDVVWIMFEYRLLMCIWRRYNSQVILSPTYWLGIRCWWSKNREEGSCLSHHFYICHFMVWDLVCCWMFWRVVQQALQVPSHCELWYTCSCQANGAAQTACLAKNEAWLWARSGSCILLWLFLKHLSSSSSRVLHLLGSGTHPSPHEMQTGVGRLHAPKTLHKDNVNRWNPQFRHRSLSFPT